MLELILPIRVTAKDYGFNAVYAGKHWGQGEGVKVRVREEG